MGIGLNRLAYLLPALTLTLTLGCNRPPTATVAGRVQFAGQPVPSGTVTFEANGMTCLGTIKQGTFQMMYGGDPNIPVYNYRVSLQPIFVDPVIDPRTTEMKAVANADAKFIPPKYHLAETSNLTFNVNPGENRFDIDLKP